MSKGLKIVLVVSWIFIIFAAGTFAGRYVGRKDIIENAKEFICEYYFGAIQRCYKLLGEEVIDYGEPWGEHDMWIV